MTVSDKPFLIVGKTTYNYSKLLRDLNTQIVAIPVVHYNGGDPYEVFKNIVHSLIYKYPIVISESNETVKAAHQKAKFKHSIIINNTQELVDLITSNNADWDITLQTSGTTGEPKSVSHSYHNFTRNVKQGETHNDDVWGFAYNPTHMAGLQVFFQALLNTNTIVYVFDDYKSQLPYYIKEHGISHISATPTYYRSVLPFIKGIHNTVRRITSGGEKFDTKLVEGINKHFPNAKINNIYASTEAGSIFSSKGDIFSIPIEAKQYIKVVNQELLIHKTLIGASNQLNFDDDWYHTGDLVEVIQEDQFRFISRSSDVVNVGGYNVNPLKVENVLLSIHGVYDVLVKPMKNKITGNIIVADVVKNNSVDSKDLKVSIKQSASQQLKEWEVPRIINFVERIEQTRTGKKVRK